MKGSNRLKGKRSSFSDRRSEATLGSFAQSAPPIANAPKPPIKPALRKRERAFGVIASNVGRPLTMKDTHTMDRNVATQLAHLWRSSVFSDGEVLALLAASAEEKEAPKTIPAPPPDDDEFPSNDPTAITQPAKLAEVAKQSAVRAHLKGVPTGSALASAITYMNANPKARGHRKNEIMTGANLNQTQWAEVRDLLWSNGKATIAARYHLPEAASPEEESEEAPESEDGGDDWPADWSKK